MYIHVRPCGQGITQLRLKQNVPPPSPALPLHQLPLRPNTCGVTAQKWSRFLALKATSLWEN